MRGFLGLVVYRHGLRAQDRFLVECLGPLINELRRTGQVDRFWFDRYDARGPHLFAVLGGSPESRESLAEQVAATVDRYLVSHPSPATLTGERLERLHQQTRGRRQCVVDGWPGLGANDTWEVFEHPGGPLPDEDEVWRLAGELALWTIGRIAAQPALPGLVEAVRWVAAVDRALRAIGTDPAPYWRHHASTLVSIEEEALDALPEALDARPRDSLDRHWEEAERAGDAWPDLPRLVGALLRGGTDWQALRELDHTTLKQRGIPVVFHLPAVLQAWQQGRRRGRGGGR